MCNAKHLAHILYVNDTGGTDEDDEKMGVVDRKRVGRGSVSDRGKLEKDEPSTKLIKKARVLVEVEHEDTGER
ncbi:hypothetical protein HHK36_029565 [Tetracentron sinense]|uniref:Uncharacterized protein n=1 Tax=Tetracentron sinense TaxID=13715 RepID=A0A834YE80_TETSI|nr:hypothetical protein HHK36_029565 [Tetracentron sinense]